MVRVISGLQVTVLSGDLNEINIYKHVPLPEIETLKHGKPSVTDGHVDVIKFQR